MAKPDQDDPIKAQNRLGAIILSLVTLIIVGTLIFHHLEKWTWIESLYFTVVTITTVGYGDIAPTSDLSRLVAIIYILAGVGLAAGALSYMSRIYIDRQSQRLKNRQKKRSSNTNKK